MFTSEQVVPDVPTLRRIALLVMRAGQDDEGLRRPMTEIWTLIDALKKDVALGLPLDRSNAVRLSSLIDRLTHERADRSERSINGAIFLELNDLGHTLCSGGGQNGPKHHAA